MYLAIIVMLMLVLPAGSMVGEHAVRGGAWVMLLGKWYVFWGGGVRLVLAGVRQYFQPRLTAEGIFGIKGEEPLRIVQELGVGNFAIGAAGLVALVEPGFVLPVAVIAGIFYGLAGLRHASDGRRTEQQNIAMVSDFFAFGVLAVFGLIAR